mmetsp:Transcript_96599/g.201883  ORF Transcript_96599/g.201883 Transcript_96599/m.201883 type:complete len:201 (+) Transcript_96599:888-1490(+)
MLERPLMPPRVQAWRPIPRTPSRIEVLNVVKEGQRQQHRPQTLRLQLLQLLGIQASRPIAALTGCLELPLRWAWWQLQPHLFLDLQPWLQSAVALMTHVLNLVVDGPISTRMRELPKHSALQEQRRLSCHLTGSPCCCYAANAAAAAVAAVVVAAAALSRLRHVGIQAHFVSWVQLFDSAPYNRWMFCVSVHWQRLLLKV